MVYEKTNLLLISSIFLLSGSLGVNAASAQGVNVDDALSQIDAYVEDSHSQVTSVSQLRDVQPTDWAFQALQSLVERYGCIAGYPDGTYRGNRAMTRYEFAAGLNACLDRVNELIASATADLVTQEDLVILQRLQEEFQAELATLRGRVDALEARTAELEANQFSTTTKLQGQVIFDTGAAIGDDADEDVTFGGRVRLRLRTSFTGEDRLQIRLQARNIQPYGRRIDDGGNFWANVAWNGIDANNSFTLNELEYYFPVGPAQVGVGIRGFDPSDMGSIGLFLDDTVLDYFDNSPLGYDVGGQGAGVGVRVPVGPFELSGGYYASPGGAATATGPSAGLFNTDQSIAGQIAYEPNPRLSVVGFYTRYYSPVSSDNIKGNAYGVNAAFALNPRINISGWANWADTEATRGNGNGDTFSWAASLGFPDLFREGNYGALSIGEIQQTGLGPLEDTGILAQALYRIQLSDNIDVQPGVAYIGDPNPNADSTWIANLRTRFSF